MSVNLDNLRLAHADVSALWDRTVGELGEERDKALLDDEAEVARIDSAAIARDDEELDLAVMAWRQRWEGHLCTLAYRAKNRKAKART